MRYLPLLLALILSSTSVAYASATVGTVDTGYKYAWSNVGGYVNLAPSQGGITITDDGITGYAWSANSGWINFDTSLSGVTNDGEGNLGGFAWGEGAGWISFSGVTINTEGRFQGTATGGTVNGASYVISFDCTNCDVRTDWRPVSVREGTDEDGGSRSSGGSVRTPETELPLEPTTPPPSVPFTPGATPDTSDSGASMSGQGVGEGYPVGELANPQQPQGTTTDIASTTEQSIRTVVVVGGSLLLLLALFGIIWFIYRSRNSPI